MSPRLRRRATVTATRNFERNLEHIEDLLGSIDASHRFDELISDLFERVVPALERLPALGAPFHATALGDESRRVLARVMALLGSSDLRHLIRGDFIVLYLVSGRRVYLLAVPHHREATFRFMPDTSF